MNDFEWCKKAWLKGWADEEKLEIWVRAGRLTQGEYEEIIALPRE